MKYFLLGLSVGLGLGLIFAPFSGEETRHRIADRAVEGARWRYDRREVTTGYGVVGPGTHGSGGGEPYWERIQTD